MTASNRTAGSDGREPVDARDGRRQVPQRDHIRPQEKDIPVIVLCPNGSDLAAVRRRLGAGYEDLETRPLDEAALSAWGSPTLQIIRLQRRLAEGA